MRADVRRMRADIPELPLHERIERDRDELLEAAERVLRHWRDRHADAAWYSDLERVVAKVNGG